MVAASPFVAAIAAVLAGQVASSPLGIDGAIRLPADALAGVASVAVDGAALAQREDGTMLWVGAPGAHTVIAVREDGARSVREIVVDPRSVTELVFTFEEAPMAASFRLAEEETEASFRPRWWFWVSIGAAVLAGAATSIALIARSNGTTDRGDSGAISGAY